MISLKPCAFSPCLIGRVHIFANVRNDKVRIMATTRNSFKLQELGSYIFTHTPISYLFPLHPPTFLPATHPFMLSLILSHPPPFSLPPLASLPNGRWSVCRENSPCENCSPPLCGRSPFPVLVYCYGETKGLNFNLHHLQYDACWRRPTKLTMLRLGFSPSCWTAVPYHQSLNKYCWLHPCSSERNGSIKITLQLAWCREIMIHAGRALRSLNRYWYVCVVCVCHAGIRLWGGKKRGKKPGAYPCIAAPLCSTN